MAFPGAHPERVRQGILRRVIIGLAAIGCGLVGTFVGMSLSDLLSIAMPRLFDQSIRLELLLYLGHGLFLNAAIRLVKDSTYKLVRNLALPLFRLLGFSSCPVLTITHL